MEKFQSELTFDEVFHACMKKLSDISLHCPRKTFDEIHYVISILENLKRFPFDSRNDMYDKLFNKDQF